MRWRREHVADLVDVNAGARPDGAKRITSCPSPTVTFDELIEEAERAPITGWDFAWLGDRAMEERPTWHFFDLVAARTPSVRTLLDVQVGSGGMIAALPKVPAVTVGTEGYGANVPVAARR